MTVFNAASQDKKKIKDMSLNNVTLKGHDHDFGQFFLLLFLLFTMLLECISRDLMKFKSHS